MTDRMLAVRADLPDVGEAELDGLAARLRHQLASLEPDLLAGTGRRGGQVWLFANDPEALPATLDACRRTLVPSRIEWATGRLVSSRVRATAAAKDAPWAMPVAFAAPEAELPELDDLYEHEHTPALLETPSWVAIRRYAVTEASDAGWTRIAVHDLAAADAMSDPMVAASRELPRFRELANRSWFTATRPRPLRRC